MDTKSYIKRLGAIKELNKRKGGEKFVNRDLYRLLIKDNTALVDAYESIKNNKGALTPAIGSETLDGFGIERLESLIGKLKDESWKPRPAKRKYIPKSGKKELRPLSIQGPEEKILQAAVKRILETIYEPMFFNCSYGFRTGRECHDALKYINQNFDNVSYFIEGNIKGMYDNVNHHVLIKLLERKINDARFIRLIWKLLRAGYMEANKYLVKSEFGTPQGSIVSPILANICLHELDIFMQDYVILKQEKRATVKTPEMKNLLAKIRKITKLLKNANGIEKETALKELKSLKWEMVNVNTYVNPPNRVYFVRYADDFIIGIAGPKSLAELLKAKIQKFLKEVLMLELNVEKTSITKAKQKWKPAMFLGHEIFVDTSTKFTRVHAKKKSPFLKKTTGFFIRLQAPMAKICKKLKEKGFCDNFGRPKPKDIWTTQEDWIIVRNFNYIVRGIFQFYRGAHYQHRLGRMMYIMKFSCAMTLAKKHKSSLSKIFQKLGNTLTVEYKMKSKLKKESFFAPVLKESSRKWLTGKVIRDPL